MTRSLALKWAGGAVATLTAGAVLVVVLSQGGTTRARSWIDDPLSGARLPLGTVDIVAHGADPDGVAAVELTVNGAVAQTQEVAGGPVLATVRFTWAATGPGAAQLVVRSRDGGGDWGEAARAIIYFGGTTPEPTIAGPTASAGPSPDPVPTQSPTTPPATTAPAPRPTGTTAPPPCTTIAAPGLVSPAAGATVGSVSPVVRWSYSGPCPINGFALELGTDRDISRILRSTTTAGGVLTWTVAPPLFDCQRYYWRVRALGATPGPWSTVSSFVVGVGRCP